MVGKSLGNVEGVFILSGKGLGSLEFGGTTYIFGEVNKG